MKTMPSKSVSKGYKVRVFIGAALRWFLGLFQRNLLKKAVALGITLGLFLYFEMNNITEKIVTVPLEVQLKDGTALAQEPPQRVSFHLVGTKKSLDSFDHNVLEAQIKVNETQAGTYRYKPIPSRGIPKNIQLIRIVPREIDIQLNTISEKIVEVIPEFVHTPAKGYEQVTYKISPKRIKIKGPSDIIDSIVDLNTQPISLRNLSENKEVETTINKNVNALIEFNKERMYKVLIYISPKHQVVTFPNNIPIEITGLIETLSILGNPGELAITNLRYQLIETTNRTQSSTKIQAIADMKNITEAGIYEVPVKLITPDNWKVVGYEPAVLSLTVELSSKERANNPANTEEGTSPNNRFQDID